MPKSKRRKVASNGYSTFISKVITNHSMGILRLWSQESGKPVPPNLEDIIRSEVVALAAAKGVEKSIARASEIISETTGDRVDQFLMALTNLYNAERKDRPGSPYAKMPASGAALARSLKSLRVSTTIRKFELPEHIKHLGEDEMMSLVTQTPGLKRVDFDTVPEDVKPLIASMLEQVGDGAGVYLMPDGNYRVLGPLEMF